MDVYCNALKEGKTKEEALNLVRTLLIKKKLQIKNVNDWNSEEIKELYEELKDLNKKRNLLKLFLR